MIATTTTQTARQPEIPIYAEGPTPDLPTEGQIADDEQDLSETPTDQHPLGVRPSGNALTSQENAQAAMGLFGMLPDAFLLTLLEFSDQSSLVNLGSTCRGLYAYCSFDQLWRDLAVNNMTEGFSWRGSWRSSLRRLPSASLAKVDCRYLFSDALHRPFLCSQISLSPYVSNIPSHNQIPRMQDLSLAEFNEAWSDRPFILTSPVKQWPVYKKWNLQTLLEEYADVPFRAEAVDWPFRTYVDYMNSTKDESPLYLFDRGFVEKMGLEVGKDGDYEAPQAFQEDLFQLLGEQRPDHRWLIIGPERSGSTFHKDPNATSAWNAVIRGSKYWIMFPASVLPPGVYMSEDQSEVTSPLSIAEWLMSFHAEARSTPGCLEGICREGEVLHVPSGWWHLVVNLDPAIAITQNFVPTSHVGATYRFLKHKANQVSGFKESITDPCGLFMERLHQKHPELAAALEDSANKKRKWEEVVSKEETGGEQSGFSFGFGDDLDDEEV
ncbi:Arginine-specific demethylase JMJ22 [Exophiala dermatitidis]